MLKNRPRLRNEPRFSFYHDKYKYLLTVKKREGIIKAYGGFLKTDKKTNQ